MAELKTKATQASVADYVAAIPDAERRADCATIIKLMQKITKQEPKMWGPSIVGFGSYRYTYESGHSGEMCQAGFSSRKPNLTVYIGCGSTDYTSLLNKLGKHKMTKSCLYIRRLSDIDLKVLEKLIAASFADVKRMYGKIDY